MGKRVKLLKILRIVWLALGLAAMLYVLFFYRKSAVIPAFVFLGGYIAIAVGLRRAEDKEKQQ